MNGKKMKMFTASLHEEDYVYVKELSKKSDVSVSAIMRFLVQYCREQNIAPTFKV